MGKADGDRTDHLEQLRDRVGRSVEVVGRDPERERFL